MRFANDIVLNVCDKSEREEELEMWSEAWPTICKLLEMWARTCATESTGGT